MSDWVKPALGGLTGGVEPRATRGGHMEKKEAVLDGM